LLASLQAAELETDELILVPMALAGEDLSVIKRAMMITPITAIQKIILIAFIP
jgi:hypothetical protein